MADPVLCASAQNPTTITSKAFEKSRPRRKARRSCSNCQRAHKTCGNERPCMQCVKRGIGLACVDGNRKPPKYLLCDFPPTKQATSPRAKQHQERKFLDITRSWNANTGFKPPLQAVQTHTKTVEQGLSEFIDPTMLHTGSPSQGSEKGLFREDSSNPPKLHAPSWADVPFEKFISPEDMSGDILAESLTIDLFRPQISNVESCDAHGSQGRRPSSGFAISSGWSSTFFPCGMDEEGEASRMVARTAECEVRLF
ncbi:hypothetical protein BJX76DRAFT_55325 [Aspergillus varians]